MGIFVNLTEIYFTGENCTKGYYLTKQIFEECFGETIDCCNDFVEENIVYGKCYGKNITYCSSMDKPLEQFGYIIQIFGVLFIVVISGLSIYAFCRFVCYKEVEDFAKVTLPNVQRVNYEKL
jgi:hypothetical protein